MADSALMEGGTIALGDANTTNTLTYLETEFLPGQVQVAAQFGFNQTVYAAEALGLALAATSGFRLILAEEVPEETNDQAASLAEAQTELMEGPEKEDMDKLLNSNSQYSWEVRVAKYPRANEKFQELWFFSQVNARYGSNSGKSDA